MAGESEVEIKGEAAEAEWGSEIEIQIYKWAAEREKKGSSTVGREVAFCRTASSRTPPHTPVTTIQARSLS